MPTYVEYLRTNYSTTEIELTNWIYRTSDSFSIILRMAGNPSTQTLWPVLCATDMNNQQGPLYMQWNLWSGRETLNVCHAGTWAGDDNYSYNSPFDYDNYYRFRLEGANFYIDKGGTPDTLVNIVSATVGITSDTDTDTVKFFLASKPADIMLYNVTVYRSGEKIHDYRPASTGLFDIVENVEIVPTGTGWTPGPEIEPPTPPAGDVNIVLQYSASENNRVDKDLTEIATYSGTLRQSTSIIDPVFVVECSLPDVVGANYLTVEAFGRSYFIKNITSHRAGLVEFSCHVDVLSSFKTQLRTNRAIVHRSEKNWNLYLNDGSLKVKQTPKVTTQEFPGSFGNSYSYILVLAG